MARPCAPARNDVARGAATNGRQVIHAFRGQPGRGRPGRQAYRGTLRVIVELKIDPLGPPSRDESLDSQDQVLRLAAPARTTACFVDPRRPPFMGMETSADALRHHKPASTHCVVGVTRTWCWYAMNRHRDIAASRRFAFGHPSDCCSCFYSPRPWRSDSRRKRPRPVTVRSPKIRTGLRALSIAWAYRMAQRRGQPLILADPCSHLV